MRPWSLYRLRSGRELQRAAACGTGEEAVPAAQRGRQYAHPRELAFTEPGAPSHPAFTATLKDGYSCRRARHLELRSRFHTSPASVFEAATGKTRAEAGRPHCLRMAPSLTQSGAEEGVSKDEESKEEQASLLRRLCGSSRRRPSCSQWSCLSPRARITTRNEPRRKRPMSCEHTGGNTKGSAKGTRAGTPRERSRARSPALVLDGVNVELTGRRILTGVNLRVEYTAHRPSAPMAGTMRAIMDGSQPQRGNRWTRGPARLCSPAPRHRMGLPDQR